MERLIALGTGNAMVTKCYNTCFAIETDGDITLVDAGGGNGILVQLQKADLSCANIHNLIVTHEHCDHLLGVVWILRKIGTMMLANKYEGNLTIWCHENLATTIHTLASLSLQKKFVNLIGDRIIMQVITDGMKADVMGHDVTFFDIHSTKAEQYGFTMQLQNGEKLTCLGDEPYNPICEPYVRGTHMLLCEAFCLYGERDIFKPYEKHHTTVKEACEQATEMQIPNLVIWHTEDTHYAERKALYTAEATQYYQGNVFVPDDLDCIALS